MKRNTILFSLVSCLVLTTISFYGCKKQDQPEQTPQSVTIESNQETTKQALSVEPDSIIKENLRILYVSNPDSTRAKDFVNFLSKHFAAVQTGDLKTFREADSEGFDVTILDYDGDGFKAPRPQISPNFSRPVVTVGVIGAHICDSLSLKTGYL